MMRANFTLTSEDAILNISNGLRQDAELLGEFKVMIPDETTSEVLWGLFVTRICTLHGTERAAQLTSKLVSVKRKSESVKSVRMTATMEQLRVVKKQKKMQQKQEFVDLTLVTLVVCDLCLSAYLHACVPVCPTCLRA